ncbi:MAG: 3-deoxy-manno-octulosonate cytidylyltransferase [Candidatus Omnitrophota bacterium]
MKKLGVIPARFASTRLPGKVLRKIAGRPMIQHVWEQCKKARRLSEVIIACDDEQVLRAAQSFGAHAMMTRSDHSNGTSRIAEIAEKQKADVYLNIQADEPMVRPEAIDRLADIFEAEPSVEIATLCVMQQGGEGFRDPNTVKVVQDGKGYALYFSRAPIPFPRDEKAGATAYLKHLGIYGYRRDFLMDFVRWPVSALENIEKLEQLRVLERGHRLRLVETSYDSMSVDTEEDLARVEAAMQRVRG